ncbi:conserved hypothetical protein [Rhodobacteraceae bacterium KLH11]|nr:conserved hypothetical protein [Rhodobacteraceae bacterium KLH11]
MNDMTEAESKKLDAEIANLNALSAKLVAETYKLNAEGHQNDERFSAEIAKLVAETAKLNSENRWYPLVVGSGLTLAIVAIVKLFL